MANINSGNGVAPKSRLSNSKLLIVAYSVIVCGLSWLVSLPLWLSATVRDTAFQLVAIAMMFTPALAAVVVMYWIERTPHPFRNVGLYPIGPFKSFSKYLLLALLGMPVVVVLALLVGAALGVYPSDFVHFSQLRHEIASALSEAGVKDESPPIGFVVCLQILAIVTGAFINMIPALGEELGWRGWLFPRLLRFGRWPALVFSGLIWGVWHSPLLLLGYNYPDSPGWLAIVCMCATCVLVGSVLCWLRLRSGSIWAPALAHGAFNAAVPGFMQLFQSYGSDVDTTSATILGWSGWIIMVPVFVAVGLSIRNAPSEVGACPESDQ
jgi:membrane protease YdiL (CAAX protease family)